MENKPQYFIAKMEILWKLINIHEYADEQICIT